MVIALGILALLMMWKVRLAPSGKWMEDYLSIPKTMAIKGIFVMLVLFSHCSHYMHLEGALHAPYLALQNYLSQMVVVMFLFYSGYGMMEAIQRKKYDYIRTIGTHRFLKVFVNFNLALLLYLITQTVLGKHYSLPHLALSMIGLRSIGNSNWYIFVTLLLYVVVFVSFYALKYQPKQKTLYLGAYICTLIIMGYMGLMAAYGMPTRFYNTIIVFALGLWYSLLKPSIETLWMHQEGRYWKLLGVFFFMYLITSSMRHALGVVSYSLWAMMFTLLIVFITMKVSIYNRGLVWLGEHTFSIYILQRIPMILCQRMGLFESAPMMTLILVVAVTLGIAACFDAMTTTLWRRRTMGGTYLAKNKK